MSLRRMLDEVDEVSQRVSDMAAIALRRAAAAQPETGEYAAAVMLSETCEAARLLITAAKQALAGEPKGDGLDAAVESAARAIGILAALQTVWKAIDKVKEKERDERDDK